MIEPKKKVGPFVVDENTGEFEKPAVVEKTAPKPDVAKPAAAEQFKKPSRIASLAKRRGWSGKAVKPSTAAEGGEDDRPQQSIVPHASVASTALTLVVAIMTFLASLTLGAVTLVNDSARGWTSDVSREVTVQIAPAEGRDLAADILSAQTIAGAMVGIVSVKVMDDAQVSELLAPWLGAGLDPALGGVADALPIPAMIMLGIDLSNPPDLDTLRVRLETEIPTATLDDHRAWVGRLATMAGSMIAIGIVIFLLVVAATVLIVVFATRGAMAGNAHVIEVLHFVGAEPPYIAGQFQKHFLLLGLRGAVVGGVAAIISFIVMGYWTGTSVADPAAEQVRALFGTFSVGPAGYLGVAILIFAVALLTAFTSRYTVMRHVGGLDGTVRSRD
ncbi:ABC transporter permease [Ahrensia sp. R2A130]|uniref:cell division protein FtsX n=1 Tax=Ahrensia sp. R2A130 TaxID=744979 RepID=UPI0001E0E8EF|nr:ABC transporter permease [Ahrensia sp. R2A130]EFL88009.1 cell division protein [Ahrensia sp. R2A130]